MPRLTEPISVCVLDFNGYTSPGHFPVAMWADWDGSRVVFGGDWREIPDWVIDREPTEDKVCNYVNLNNA
jgi:hypothetical protein